MLAWSKKLVSQNSCPKKQQRNKFKILFMPLLLLPKNRKMILKGTYVFVLFAINQKILLHQCFIPNHLLINTQKSQRNPTLSCDTFSNNANTLIHPPKTLNGLSLSSRKAFTVDKINHMMGRPTEHSTTPPTTHSISPKFYPYLWESLFCLKIMMTSLHFLI